MAFGRWPRWLDPGWVVVGPVLATVAYLALITGLALLPFVIPTPPADLLVEPFRPASAPETRPPEACTRQHPGAGCRPTNATSDRLGLGGGHSGDSGPTQGDGHQERGGGPGNQGAEPRLGRRRRM